MKKARPQKPAVAALAPGPLDRWLGMLSRAMGIDGLDAPENRLAVKWGLGLALLAMVLRAIFWAYTQRYWEDSLITCMHSENFVLGLGMTHVRPGEPPLHGFTSPLSVLVPLIGDLMRVGFGVEFIKLVTMPAAALTVLYLVGICIHPAVRMPAPLAVMLAGYAAVEHQQILFGMAGMETQLAVLVIVASIYHAIAWHPARLGVWLGLCMLARPDFAFWCVLIGVYGLYREWRRMPIVVGLAVAVYAPWVAFTLWHYGSPIPNTMVAKSLGYKGWWDFVPEMSFSYALQAMGTMMVRVLHITLGPTFKGHGTTNVPLWEGGGEQSYIANVMAVFALAGLVFILWRRRIPLWPVAAGAIVYSLYYIWFVPVVVGWYMPPYVLLLLLLAVYGIHSLSLYIPDEEIRAKALWSAAAVYLGAFVFWLPYTFYAEHQIQTYVENGVRMQAGLFLRDRMKPDEAVGCEPLGYMGYYSRGNVYDWPGLDSRKVVAWSKSVPKEHRMLENMLKALEPEYLYLRDAEFLGFKDRPWFIARYRPLQQFHVKEEDRKKVPWIEKNVDTNFWIYKKAGQQ